MDDCSKSIQALETMAETLSPDVREAYRAFGLLMLVSHGAQRALNTQLAQQGLSFSKLRLMTRLYLSEEGVMPSEVAEVLGVTRSTMTGLIDGLERDGLLQRREHEVDRRMTLLQLTPAGRDFMRVEFPQKISQTCHLMGALSEDEQTQLAALLKKASSTYRI